MSADQRHTYNPTQLDTLPPETLEALLQLCEDWQKHAFAVGFTAAVRLLT